MEAKRMAPDSLEKSGELLDAQVPKTGAPDRREFDWYYQHKTPHD